MRYQTWGISRIRLLAFALTPAIAWALFRVQTMHELSLQAIFLYYRMAIWVWGAALLLASFGWIFFFRRGLFRARYVAYSFFVMELFFELLISVTARDLFHLCSALVYFIIVIALTRWMEAWVELAAFNPKIQWFEGRPKVIPHLAVQVRTVVARNPESGVEGGEGAWLKASVRRLDRKGLFIVLDQPVDHSPDFGVRKRMEFKLQWRGSVVLGEGRVVGRLKQFNAPRQVSGIGLLFFPKGLYHFIQYTALYESLKGEGYAF